MHQPGWPQHACNTVTVKLDKTGPSADLTPTGTLGTNGWYIGDVIVSANGADSISDPVICDMPTTLDNDTAGTLVDGLVHQRRRTLDQRRGPDRQAGQVRTRPPQLSVSAGTLGTNGWYIDDVTVHDLGGGHVSDPSAALTDQHQTIDTTGTRSLATCTNDAGRTQAAAPLTVKRDASPPTAHLAVISGTAGANGWYISAVTVASIRCRRSAAVSPAPPTQPDRRHHRH